MRLYVSSGPWPLPPGSADTMADLGRQDQMEAAHGCPASIRRTNRDMVDAATAALEPFRF
jgi:hypothetical protein